MKESDLKRIIAEEVRKLIAEQEGPAAPDGNPTRFYTDDERDDLNPIKRSHRNQGMGPTKLNVLVNALHNAQRAMETYIRANDSRKRSPTDPKTKDALAPDLLLHDIKMVRRYIGRIQDTIKDNAEIDTIGDGEGVDPKDPRRFKRTYDSGLN